MRQDRISTAPRAVRIVRTQAMSRQAVEPADAHEPGVHIRRQPIGIGEPVVDAPMERRGVRDLRHVQGSLAILVSERHHEIMLIAALARNQRLDCLLKRIEPENDEAVTKQLPARRDPALHADIDERKIGVEQAIGDHPAGEP